MEPVVADTSNELHERKRGMTFLAFGALAVALAAAVIWYVAARWNIFSDTYRGPQPSLISQEVRSGNYAEAVDEYERAVASGALGANRYAMATINVFEALYKSNGRVEDVIAGIRALKQAFENPDISDFTRAQIIMTLASAYNDTGENPLVLEEVYRDQPFRNYYNESRSRTQRNMMKWAFALYPNSRAAISIAGSYVNYALGRPYVPGRMETPDDTSDLVAKAKDFLKRSDELLTAEVAKDPSFKESSRYAAQQYWRAFVMGSTVYLGDSEFRDSYGSTYKSFISHFSQNGSAEAKQYIPFAYLNYAIVLSAIEKNEALASMQIVDLMKFVNADPNKDVSEFVTLLKNEEKRRETEGPNYNSAWLDRFAATVPGFQDFIDSIQGTSIGTH